VIKTGGKQYRVAAEDVITVAKLDKSPGESVTFDNVLMFTNDGGTQIGAVAGVTVAGEVVEQKRGPKVIAFKKRRRQNSKRKRGHRQDFTVVRITGILTGGAKPAARAAAAEPEPGPVEARAEVAQAETRAAETPAAAEEAPAEAAAPKKPRAPRKKKTAGEEPTGE
jgi:large subunit ribosomal protein L21